MKTFSFQTLFVTMLLTTTLCFTLFLIFSRPTPEVAERKPIVTPVAIITVEPKEEQILLTAYGTVQQTRSLQLQTEVKGRIIELHPNLNLGGLIAKGEIILRLQPDEYEAAVKMAAAEVANAEAELKIEQGRSWIAQKEFELLEKDVASEALITDLGDQLVLRQPQAASREAALEGAKGRLEQAELNLERTTLFAPFNLVVITESVDLGQVVSPGQTLATLVTSDYFVVIATLPVEQLHWIYKRGNLPEVSVFLNERNGKSLTKTGSLNRIIPLVSKEGRMVRLSINVPDPLDLKKPLTDRHPLLLDNYVRVTIPGPTLSDLFRVPREAIQDDNSVWIIDAENRLRSAPVSIIHRYPDFVLVSEGLKKGDRVITSRIGIPVPGMPLRVVEKEE